MRKEREEKKEEQKKGRGKGRGKRKRKRKRKRKGKGGQRKRGKGGENKERKWKLYWKCNEQKLNIYKNKDRCRYLKSVKSNYILLVWKNRNVNSIKSVEAGQTS